MSNTFDIESARTKLDEILYKAEHIRNGLTKDIIDFNRSKHPQTEEEQHHQKEDIRKYLHIAVVQIDDLLKQVDYI